MLCLPEKYLGIQAWADEVTFLHQSVSIHVPEPVGYLDSIPNSGCFSQIWLFFNLKKLGTLIKRE